MSVYSDRFVFAEYTPAGGVIDLYTVPAGERHVFRDIRLRSSVANKLVQVYAVGAGSEIGYIVRRTLTDTNVWPELEARATLRAGDVVKLFAESGTQIVVMVSGYRLTA